jgi:hypothetical protein
LFLVFCLVQEDEQHGGCDLTAWGCFHAQALDAATTLIAQTGTMAMRWMQAQYVTMFAGLVWRVKRRFHASVFGVASV